MEKIPVQPDALPAYYALRRQLGLDVTPIMEQIDRYAQASVDATDFTKSPDVRRASFELAKSLRETIALRLRSLQ